MDRISNVEIRDERLTGFFQTNDIYEINMLQRAILTEVETYAIDIVMFDKNNSSRHDEIIALRLGQLVIDNSRFVPPETGDFKAHIDVSGPGEFTTDDIPLLPFKYKTPIAQLRAGQRIVCDVIVKLGYGRLHVKWRPVSTFTFEETNDGFNIALKGIGMLPPLEIIEKGFAKMDTATRRPASSIFTRPVAPNNFVQ